MFSISVMCYVNVHINARVRIEHGKLMEKFFTALHVLNIYIYLIIHMYIFNNFLDMYIRDMYIYQHTRSKARIF